MGRKIPVTPNHNTRLPSMSLIPLKQKIQWIKSGELDAWGADDLSAKPVWLDCKIQYSHQRFFLRAHQGYEREDSAYIMFRNKVEISTSDTLRYHFPDGAFMDYKPLQISHIFDMAGGIFLTKVWVK